MSWTRARLGASLEAEPSECPKQPELLELRLPVRLSGQSASPIPWMYARTAVRRWTETDRTAVRSMTEYEIRPSEYDRPVGRPRISAGVSDAEIASRLAVMADRAPALPDLFAHRLGA